VPGSEESVSLTRVRARAGVSAIPPEHGGILTGHWEFDLAIACLFLAIVTYSFLLPADAPRGVGRVAILGMTGIFCAAALTLAVIGFRSL
jgi:hypothetical protein